jgi:hypothetical protein
MEWYRRKEKRHGIEEKGKERVGKNEREERWVKGERRGERERDGKRWIGGKRGIEIEKERDR